MQIRILENMQQKIFTRSSFEFAYRFPKIKSSEFNHYYPPELANRFFDTLTVQKGLAKILLDFPAAILQIIFGLILLSLYHPFFIIYGLLLVIMVYVVFNLTARKGLISSLNESKSKYAVAHWLQEIARSITSFKLSGNTSLAMDRNNKLTESYLESRETHFKILMLQFVQMIGFKVLVTAGLLLIGGLLVLNQEMNIGQFVAAEIIILLVINSVEKLVTGLESFYDVLTSLEKIGQVVDKELESQDGTNPFKSNKEATISLDNVSYVGGTGDTILQNLNLELNPKDRIFIDGPSGSGKTTLLKLLSGIIEPTSGSIYVNDFNIKGMHMNTYRSQIGQVLPEQMPFEGSILENITLGNTNITIDKVNQTIRDVGLLEFVRKQPRGIEDFIFSEGQKIPHTVSKRLLIARAIVHNPKILILKDALEHFEDHEAQELIRFLSDPNRDWLLIVSGKHTDWEDVCNKQLSLHKVNTSS
jgi:ABC-type bacteriocin/lantibiotic exporter with double-glycine peptidase domain